MSRKLAAEAVGTFWLVFAICLSAITAAGFPELGIGFAGVALAAGIAILSMAYAVGGISGGHFNPAVSLGLAIAGRFEWRDMIPYWVAQVVGGLVGAALAFFIVSGTAHFVDGGGFASNGYGEFSPGGYSLFACLLAEVLLTAIFLIIILGSTSAAAPAGFAPLTIGLGLVVIHLASIPITNTSVNPARSLATAIVAGFEGHWGPLSQVWLFIVAPLIGGALGGLLWRALFAPGESPAGVGRVP
jgi:aquaporin Z